MIHAVEARVESIENSTVVGDLRCADFTAQAENIAHS
jgi:hypothetical protein